MVYNPYIYICFSAGSLYTLLMVKNKNVLQNESIHSLLYIFLSAVDLFASNTAMRKNISQNREISPTIMLLSVHPMAVE